MAIEVARRGGQDGVALVGHPLRAERRRLQFIGRQHQRRHVEVAAEDVADAGLAADRRPLPDQVGDVAVDGPLRHFELLGQGAGGDRARRTPEDLDDLKQSVGAAHERLHADRMVSAGVG